MLNLRPVTGPALRSVPTHPHSSRLTARRARFNLGADHVHAEYLEPARVTARRAQLRAEGYAPPHAWLAVRLEGR